jgi:outer membrane protein
MNDIFKESSDPMTSKFLRSIVAIAVISTISAWAQAAGTAPTDTPAAANVVAAGSGTKLGTINIEQAVIATNEGQRDFAALQKKLEPKQNELKGQNDELQSLQEQLQKQGDKLNDDAKATLIKQIETKKKALDRAVQDFQEDGRNQQGEVFQRILDKMKPGILKYVVDNKFGVIVDTSNPWPQGPVLWADPGVDITKPVVDAYNAQSGVPAPAATPGTAAKPPAPRMTPKPTTPNH